jgi:hypothetical protein
MAIGYGLGFFYCNWIFLSIIEGNMVARVLGLIKVRSFLCYFMIMLLASTRIIVKTKFDVFLFFDSWNHITIDGIAQGFTMHALTFIPLSKLIPIFANCATSFCEDMTLLQQPPSNMICFSCNKFLNSYNPLGTTF